MDSKKGFTIGLTLMIIAVIIIVHLFLTAEIEVLSQPTSQYLLGAKIVYESADDAAFSMAEWVIALMTLSAGTIMTTFSNRSKEEE